MRNLFIHTTHICVLVVTTSMVFAFSACDEGSPDNPGEYLALIKDPKSGLSKEKLVGDVKLSVRYMPPEFFALKETSTNGGDYDAILESRRQGMSFVIHVDTRESGQDIMGKNLQGFEDYQERVMLLNFDIKNYLRLETSDTVLHPVLGTMENIYGLATGRNLIVVFAADSQRLLSESERFDIVFDDPVFGTGINRFSYKTIDILQAPKPQS